MNQVFKPNENYQTLLDQCHKPFKWHEHEFNPQGHIYVKIAQTIVRLNSLGVPWNLVQGEVTITDNPNKTRTGKDQYDAVCSVQLEIEGLGSRGAPGSSTSTDKDNASKAAHSYALRKAGSLFGISHYLMVNPQAESNFVKFMETADLEDLDTLKKAIILCAKIDGMSGSSWLKIHGVDQATVESCNTVLRTAGRV